MAKDELNLAPDDKDTADSKGGGGGKKIIIIVLAALLLVGAGGGAAWFLLGGDKAPVVENDDSDADESDESDESGGEDDEEASEEDDEDPRAAEGEEANYWPLSPAFIINFSLDDGMHYLQLDLQAMSYSKEAIEKLKAHTPAVRNDLILLFSSQDYNTLNSLEGKEALRGAALKQVNKTLRLKSRRNRIDDLYFTSFMMQ